MSDWTELLTEGDAGPFLFTLLDAGATFNATGMTLAMIMKDKDGTAVAPTAVGWSDATVSKATFTLATTDLTNARAPYTVHWKVTNGTQVVHYPKPALILRVAKP